MEKDAEHVGGVDNGLDHAFLTQNSIGVDADYLRVVRYSGRIAGLEIFEFQQLAVQVASMIDCHLAFGRQRESDQLAIGRSSEGQAFGRRVNVADGTFLGNHAEHVQIGCGVARRIGQMMDGHAIVDPQVGQCDRLSVDGLLPVEDDLQRAGD